MAADRPKASDDDHRVVPFRPRSSAARGTPRWRWPLQASRGAAPPAEGFGRYEGGEEGDNYRHRMMVNLAALGFTVLLAAAGVWLTIQIADMRKTQDCFLSGRRNCSPIDVKTVEH